MFDSENVGLITGDVSTNSTAPILVMTAEVLRNHMMMISSPLLSRVRHVVLDEAHYLGDAQRGVVWEQIIISATPNIRFVLLTATLPNGDELAGWVSKCTGVDTNMVTQIRRPVPLRINSYSDTRSIEVIKDGENPADKGLISEICKTTGILGAVSQKYSLPREAPHYSTAAHVKEIIGRGCSPLILFCLSRRRCVQVANDIEGVKDGDALAIFDEASKEWDQSIRESDQYAMVRDLISRSIGIHHSGIIPILRETVELLFSHGHLAVLVATETFALGVNAPAKGVMFSSLVKWGGTAFRPVSTAEFMQMAGRAGRRGYDDHGDVFVPLQEGTAPEFILSIIETTAEKLVSQMRISPWLVLSCKASGHDPHEFFDRSLMRFQNLKRLNELKQIKLKEPSDDEKQAFEYSKKFREVVQICLHPKNINNILVPGRLVYIKFQGVTWGWSSTLRVDKENIEVIISAVKNEHKLYVPCSDVKVACLLDVTFPISAICLISSITITNPKTSAGMERASLLLDVLKRIRNKFKDIPLIKATDFQYGKERANALIPQIRELYGKMNEEQRKSIFSRASVVEENVNIAAEIENLENPPDHDLIDKLSNELVKLGYFTNEGITLLKGNVSHCFKVEDPVPMTEILLSGIFLKIEPPAICVVASCFVESPPLFKCQSKAEIIELWGQIKRIIAPIKELDMFKKPHKKLMDFTDNYLKTGSVAAAIKESPGLSEGMAVRIIKRIREIIVMFADASKCMGPDIAKELGAKFAAAQEALSSGSKMDSSLYKIE